jgi:hypothetical protein
MIKKFNYNGRALKHETESAAKELIITKRKIKSEVALLKRLQALVLRRFNPNSGERYRVRELDREMEYRNG